MIFSKLASSVARSSRSKGLVYGGGVRSAILSEGRLLTPPALEAASNQVDGGLGFLRKHFASLAARKGTDDLSRVFANSRLRRFFSSESPKKKNYEKYYPKDAKQTPKNEQKSESRGA